MTRGAPALARACIESSLQYPKVVVLGIKTCMGEHAFAGAAMASTSADAAATALQKAARARSARKVYDTAKEQDRLVMMMLALEDDRATWVQRAWREKVRLRRLEREERSALCVQTLFRGHRIRADAWPEMQFAHVRESIAARRIQKWARRRIEGAMMREECRGVLDKRVRKQVLPFGMEYVVWGERFVYTTKTELCYAKFTRGREVDESSTKRIRYADIAQITGELDTGVLVIGSRNPRRPRQGRLRYVRFQLPTTEEAEVWAANLLRLVTIAGFKCEGALELPGSAEDAAHDDWMNELASTIEAALPAVDGAAKAEPQLRMLRRETTSDDLLLDESTPTPTPGQRGARGQLGAPVRPSLVRA